MLIGIRTTGPWIICYKSAVCILLSVCILPLVRSLQSAVRSLRFTLTGQTISFERPKNHLRRSRCIQNGHVTREKSQKKCRIEWWEDCIIFLYLNPRTYPQIHTPTVIQIGGGGGGGGVEPLPRGFDMLQYFETILPSIESLSSSQQGEVKSRLSLRTVRLVPEMPKIIYSLPLLYIRTPL